jgi:hypothetical protein
VNRVSELVHDAVFLLRDRGLVPTVSNGGKHFKVSWVANGRRHTLVISRSPSDRRARLASRAILRRLLNGGAP